MGTVFRIPPVKKMPNSSRGRMKLYRAWLRQDGRYPIEIGIGYTNIPRNTVVEPGTESCLCRGLKADERKLSSPFLPDCLTAEEPIKLKFKKRGGHKIALPPPMARLSSMDEGDSLIVYLAF